MPFPSRYIRDDNAPADLLELLSDVEEEVREEVLPHIPDFEDFEVYPVKGIKHMGKFVRPHTSVKQLPVVVVSLRVCRSAAERYCVEERLSILTTILHELGHAIQYARGMKMDEDQAESLPLTYYRTGKIAEWVTT